MSADYKKMILQYVLPKQALTLLAGFLADLTSPLFKNHLIKWFIQQYDVDMQEACDEQPEQYPTFNDFFIRRLKPGLRPTAEVDVVSPVDGFVSELGVIEQGQLVQAKGRYYAVDELLGSDVAQASAFYGGSFATLYLSPKDYHRVHMPMDGLLHSMEQIPGALFSVQPATTRMIPRLFARNKRLVVFFETEVGRMAMILVGATIVGKIGTAWLGDLPTQRHRQSFRYGTEANPSLHLKQSDEMGYFKLGSTVILLFQEGARVAWNPALCTGSRLQVGCALAQFL